MCRIAQGDPEYRAAHEVIDEDAELLVFLNRYPVLCGYTLVCPRRHVEQVTRDFSEAEYLALQRWTPAWAKRSGRCCRPNACTCSVWAAAGNCYVNPRLAACFPMSEFGAWPSRSKFNRGVWSVPRTGMSQR